MAQQLSNHNEEVEEVGKKDGTVSREVMFGRGIVILLIVLLAWSLRTYNLELIRFGIDQSSHFEIIDALARGEWMPRVGAYVGFTPARLGPFHYYLFLPARLLSPDPETMIRFSALLNCLVIPLFFLMAKGRWSFAVSLVTSLLYAVSPYMVYVSRDFWNLSAMPLFVCLFFYVLLELIDSGKKIHGILGILLVGLLSQLHITAVVFLPLVLWLIVKHLDKGKIPTILWGFVLFILSYAPWLYHQFSMGFEDILAYLSFISGSGGSASEGAVSFNLGVFPLLLEYPWWFYNYVSGYSSLLFSSRFFSGALTLESFLFLLGFIVLLWTILFGKQGLKKQYNFLFLFGFLLPLLLLTFFRYEVYDRHLLLVFPLPFLLIGLISEVKIGKNGLLSGIVLTSAMIFLVVTGILVNFEFYRQVEKSASIQSELPLKWKKCILEKTSERSGEVNPGSLIGAIHPFGTKDTATDFQPLALLLTSATHQTAEQYDLSLPHTLFYRQENFEFFRGLIAEEIETIGAAAMASIPSMIDYASLQVTYLNDPQKKWRNFRNPLIELERFDVVQVQGNITITEGTQENFLVIFTNIPIFDVEIDGIALTPYNSFLSQIATNEVHATERLFQLPTQLPSGTHRFTFKSGPASRWYNLNIFAFARYPWRQEFSLLRRGEILLNQSKISVAGAFLQSTAGVQLSYHLPEHNDWVSLEYVNQQRAFCQPFNQLYLQLKSDGFTGLLRVTLKEKNGEHWVYDDYHCLENRKEFPLTLPWQRFTLPSWRKQGNGIFEADKITCVEISFHPYKTSPGTREILIKSVLLTD